MIQEQFLKQKIKFGLFLFSHRSVDNLRNRRECGSSTQVFRTLESSFFYQLLKLFALYPATADEGFLVFSLHFYFKNL